MRQQWPFLREFEFPTNKSNEVTVVIGSDHSGPLDIFETRKDPLRSNSPRALLTPFGWCVAEPIAGNSGAEKINCNAIAIAEPSAVFTRMLDDFFLNDTVVTKPDVKLPVGAEEKRALEILEKTTRIVNGRIEVGLLWGSADVFFKDNKPGAMRRLLSQERRLEKDPQLHDKFVAAVQEFVSLGHARNLSAEEAANGTPGRTHYIPTHPVTNLNQPGKCRPAFDNLGRV